MDGGQIDVEMAGPGEAQVDRRSGPRLRDITQQVDGAPIASHVNPNASVDDRVARILLSRGYSTPEDVAAARLACATCPLPLGRILRARNLLTEAELLSAEAHATDTRLVDLDGSPPDPTLGALLPARAAIAAEAVPWRRAGAALVIATARADLVPSLEPHVPEGLRLHVVLASREQVLAAQTHLYGQSLARMAEARAPERMSCRGWRPRNLSRLGIATGLTIVTAALLAPQATFLVFMALALAVYAANLSLKIAAFFALLSHERHAQRQPPIPTPAVLRPPMVTVLLPLFSEAELAAHLVDRISRLDYPAERLDILLCIEEEDSVTQQALAQTNLPPHMRAIIVPDGHPRTKPRAMNYALNFAQGEILCIYDAEDRPEPDQITRVVQRFAVLPPDVACLQGRLDYYNSRHNWLSRMFTLEYASWFRLLLPGVQRLGLFVPLGGTTLFVRRNVLEALGGWDAHNVTEDAELGLRLYRAGFRTEMVDTTTFEEANAAPLAWIRQRSRWFKGYLITWATAMRAPRKLWSDLGTWRFLGFQVQMLAAVLGFLLSPLLLSLVPKTIGLPHPLDARLGSLGYGALMVSLIFGAALTIMVALYVTRTSHLRHLRPMIPLLEVYYLLGIAAAWLAMVEMIVRPFFWAKTRHGNFGSPKDPDDEPDQDFSASSFNRTTKAIDR